VGRRPIDVCRAKPNSGTFVLQDKARLFLPLHHTAIELRHVVLCSGEAIGSAVPLGFVQVFNGNRQTLQRASTWPLEECLIVHRGLRNQLVSGT